MQTIRTLQRHPLCVLAALLTISWPGMAADPLAATIDVQSQIERDAARSQDRVDEAYETKRQLLEEYRTTVRELESLGRYNDQLARMIKRQDASIHALGSQLDEALVTRRDIIPLLVRMVATLKRFIELDAPFLVSERQGRVEDLYEMIDSPKLSIGEKYRRVLEAYQIEMDYGRTVAAYRGTLPLGNGERTVDFLRVGRVSLLYRSLDGAEAGFWDEVARSWRSLPDDYRTSLQKGLRVAQKQTAPDLLRVPVPAPESMP